MFYFLAMDSPDSESATRFKEKLSICIMRHLDHKELVNQLVRSLNDLGYSNVEVCTGADAGINYRDFEIWILLPPILRRLPDNSIQNSTDYSNHVGSLYSNLKNYCSLPNPKMIIHSNLYQLKVFRTNDCRRLLEKQEKDKKWMVKDIPDPLLNVDSLSTSFWEGMYSQFC